MNISLGRILCASLATIGIGITASAQQFLIDQRSDTIFQPFAPLLPITGIDRLPGYQPAQQFVPVLNGLDFVQLAIRNDNVTEPAAFLVTIHEGSVTGAVLGVSQPVTILFPPSFVHFDFPTRVPLTPGNLYVLEVSQFGQPKIGWSTPAIDNLAYARGQAVYRWQLINSDLWFREGVTLVVPEMSITTPSASTNVVLTVRGRPGVTYTLQAASELPAVNWTNVLTFTMSESATNIVQPIETESPARFYRVFGL